MLGQFHRALGLEVSGQKHDRSAIAAMDFYPTTQRLVLVDVGTQLQSNEKSSDENLIDNLLEARGDSAQFSGLAVHAPLSFPPYLKQNQKQSFMEKSEDPEARWMLNVWRGLDPQPRMFVPYLQRPAEIWLRYLTPEKFEIAEGMGSNCAPLAARLHFLSPHLPKPLFEVFPRASMARLVSSLGMPKAIYREYRDLNMGAERREQFFEHLSKRVPQIFIYERDLETMSLQLSCFHAFLAALTLHLIVKHQCEVSPRGFPRHASWIHIPKANIAWDQVFGE